MNNYVGASARTKVLTETTWPIHIMDLNCSGSEDSIWDCPYNELHDYNDMCNEDDDAAVVCQCNIIIIIIINYFFRVWQYYNVELRLIIH